MALRELLWGMAPLSWVAIQNAIRSTWGHLKKGKFMYAKARRRGFSGFGEV
jgi:hypothetical protein